MPDVNSEFVNIQFWWSCWRVTSGPEVFTLFDISARFVTQHRVGLHYGNIQALIVWSCYESLYFKQRSPSFIWLMISHDKGVIFCETCCCRLDFDFSLFIPLGPAGEVYFSDSPCSGLPSCDHFSCHWWSIVQSQPGPLRWTFSNGLQP